MPKNARPGPRDADSEDRTNPGGPAPEVLAAAREDSIETVEQNKLDDKTQDDLVSPATGEATLIYDTNKNKRRADGPRLLVVAGPRTGSEYSLTEVETSIGRGSDNVVVIPDISVSRRHVVIALEGDKYVLIDQRSGNGTRVNGQTVDRHPLVSGDDIAMGDTVVRFVEPGGVVVKGKPAAAKVDRPAPGLITNTSQSRAVSDATQGHYAGPRPGAVVTSGGTKAPAKKGLNQRMPLYITAGGLLLVMLGLGFLRKTSKEEKKREATVAQHEGLAVAQDRFADGVQLLKDGRWVEARDKLKAAAEMAPRDQEIQRYLEKAEMEAPRAQAVADAKAALLKKDFATAKAQLANVPDDSALADSARQVSEDLKTAMDTAVHEARNKMEEGDAMGANSLIEPVLAADPGRADALAISDAVSGHRKVVATVQRGQATERRKQKELAANAPPAAVSGIVDSYVAGDIGTAIERAEGQSDPRAAKLAHDLKAFDSAYRDGLAKTQSKQLNEAIRALDSADKLDRAIAGGRDSKLGREVRRALGNLHYNLGVQLMSGNDEQLGSAASHLRYAVANDPDNEAAKRQLSEATSKVKEIYQQGYFEKDSDPDAARRAFKIVINALPASDETQQKAKRWLDKLDGKGE